MTTAANDRTPEADTPEGDSRFLDGVRDTLLRLRGLLRSGRPEDLDEAIGLQERLLRQAEARVAGRGRSALAVDVASPVRAEVRRKLQEVAGLLREQVRFLTISDRVLSDVLEDQGVLPASRGRYGPAGALRPATPRPLVEGEG